jgi:hypothetical protein
VAGQQDAGIGSNCQPAQDPDELADLGPIVFIAAEHVCGIVQYDRFWMDFACGNTELIEQSGGFH